MKKIILFAGVFFILSSVFSQNVGIGTAAPATKLDVKSASSNVAQFNGPAGTYIGILENDVYRGYFGSYAGNPEDMDFGTGTGNTTGKVHFTSQGVPKITMDNVGNLGVGTVSPNYKLHVNGGDLFVQSSSGKFILGYDGGNQWRYASTGGGADLLMSSFNGTTETFRHYFSQNGNVGFGTGATPPGAALHIKSSSASFMLKIEGANPYAALYDNTDGYKSYWWYNGTDVVIGSVGASKIKFQPNGFNSAIFHEDGRVSLGTSTPATGYQLSVKGKIISEELKVQLSGSWPDYVFKKNYYLPSLETLEQSINQNQHLPNIPSAAEVEKDGIMVGDMNKRLLEKVEELTLYLIDLNKKNIQLTTEVEQLKKEMQELKK